MCVYAWRSAWFSGADLGRLRNHSIAMGAAHNEIQWGKFLWTHLWIDHMYYFANKWRILSKFSCFAMEGSHRRLKRMSRNSGGLSLLRGRLGVQVVVDSHTIDDSLWLHGWDATKRAQHGQGPISVQTYASRTRRRLLTDMQHLQTLQRRWAAQFPPQGCGPSPPPKVGVAGGAAHVDVDDIGEGWRDAAQPTTSSTLSAPDPYVASSNGGRRGGLGNGRGCRLRGRGERPGWQAGT